MQGTTSYVQNQLACGIYTHAKKAQMKILLKKVGRWPYFCDESVISETDTISRIETSPLYCLRSIILRNTWILYVNVTLVVSTVVFVFFFENFPP